VCEVLKSAKIENLRHSTRIYADPFDASSIFQGSPSAQRRTI
jgi:hypothetical protein